MNEPLPDGTLVLVQREELDPSPWRGKVIEYVGDEYRVAKEVAPGQFMGGAWVWPNEIVADRGGDR